MSEHPDIRKLGFTGSTPIGKTIMERYQSFVSLLFLLYFLFKGLRNEKKQNSASKLFFLFVYLWGEKNHASICKYLHSLFSTIFVNLLNSCAKVNLKKVSLELGGKSPLIIFSDCDMDKAVRMVRRP